MKTKLLIEQMPRSECTKPTKEWRVVCRACTHNGLSSRSYRLVKDGKDLTFDRARATFERERRRELRAISL